MPGKKGEKDAAGDAIMHSVKGVAKSAGFSIEPNGSVGFVFNQFLDQFTVINLKNGEQSAINKDPLVVVKKVARWEGLHVVERLSRCVVLMLAVEKRTDKTYLISFAEDKADKRMKVLDELDLGVVDPKDGKEGSKKMSYIGEDGHGAIYCFTTWLDFNGSPNKATFHAVKVTVDNQGKLQGKIVFNARSVQGAHLKQPLADRSAIYMLPVYNQYDEEQIVKLPLNGAPHPKVIQAEYGEGGMPPFFCPWSQPIHLNDNTAIFYVYGTVGSHQTGQFWTLTLPEGQWRKLSFELHEHAIKDNISIVRDANDNALLLHGDCADSTCAEKAHIYRLNFDVRYTLANSYSSVYHSFSEGPGCEIKRACGTVGSDNRKLAQFALSGTVILRAKKRKQNANASPASKTTPTTKSDHPAKKPKNSPAAAKVHVETSDRLTRSKAGR